MCEKASKKGLRYGKAIGPAHKWRGGEWYEFNVIDHKVRQAIKRNNIKGWWMSSTHWGHCCGDDDGEQISKDCDPNTQDFDPITCQCVKKGEKSPLFGYNMTFRPDCAVVELNVIPADLIEGQQANIVIAVENLGDTTATNGTVTIDYGDGKKETTKIQELRAKETWKRVIQHVYSTPGEYKVTVSVSCPRDYHNDNDKNWMPVKVKNVVVSTAPPGGYDKRHSTNIVELLRNMIENISKVIFAGEPK